MPGTLFLNFFLSPVTFNVQHLELLSYTQIESYSFFRSLRCAELLPLKTAHQSVRALSSPPLYGFHRKSVFKVPSETVYCLERLYLFFLI